MTIAKCNNQIHCHKRVINIHRQCCCLHKANGSVELTTLHLSSFIYTSGKCAFVWKFPVAPSHEESVSGLQHQIMLNFLLPCQSLHVLRCTVLAAVRCVYEQTLQAYSPVCPGKVPREHIHLAHMLAPHWLFGLLCLRYKISPFSSSSF